MNKNNEYVVIMAGGGGTRLWPMSHADKPKQFQPILGGSGSLFQNMYQLLLAQFDADHIYVQVPPKFISLVMEQAPSISIGQILAEPEIRDTGPAFAFAAESIRLRDPDAFVGFYYSDHLIQSEDLFYSALHAGFHAAQTYPDNLVIIGVRPQYAHTGLGYIEMGEKLSETPHGIGVHGVGSFIEKPEKALAEKFVNSGTYLWNTGYKIGRAEHISNMLSTADSIYQKHLPLLADAIRTHDRIKTKSIYTELPKQSFEYSVTEKSGKLLVLPSDMLWSDVGDWDSVHLSLQKDNTDVHTVGVVAEEGSKNALLVSNHRPVVCVGLENIVVVETHDGVLVMSKERSGEMKKALEKLRVLRPSIF